MMNPICSFFAGCKGCPFEFFENCSDYIVNYDYEFLKTMRDRIDTILPLLKEEEK